MHGANPPADFEAVFHALPTAVLLLSSDDPSFTILAVSDAFVAAMHLERAALLGKGLFKALDDYRLDANGSGQLLASLRRVIATGQLDTPPVLAFRDARHDSVALRCVHSPVFRADGSLQGILHSVELTNTRDAPDAEAATSSALRAEALQHESLLRATHAELELSRFFSVSADLLAICSFDGKFLRLNDAWRQLGLAQDHLLNHAWMEVVHPEDQARTREAVDTLAKGHTQWRIENRVRTGAGDYRWIDWRVQGFPEERLLYAAGTDITRRKRDELALVQSRKLVEQQLAELETVYRTAPIGLALFDPVEFRYLRLNDRQAEIVGLPRNKILGRTLTEIAPIEGLNEMFRQVVAGKPVVNELLEGELPMRPGIHRYWTVNYFPVHGSDGSLQAITAASLEVTAQKHAELALEQSRKEVQRQWMELETIYRTAPIGLALFTPDEFRYARINEAQAGVLGLPVEKILGKRIRDVAPGLADQVEPLFARVVQGETIRNHEIHGSFPDRPDVERFFNVNYAPVLAADGSVLVISAVVEETTAQRRAERALIDSEKLTAMGRLAAAIAHEINNPLESVMNLVYLASTSNGLPQKVSEYLKTAEEELGRVSQIATQALRFHRQSTHCTYVTPEDLVRPVLVLYQMQLAGAGITLVQEYLPAPAVQCFENEIRQVLNNLVSNAIDAMPRGGRLIVRSRAATEWSTQRRGIRITFADTGEGMSDETQRHLFDAFYTTKGVHGTGLGLWVSDGIVKKHQGSLRVSSMHTATRSGSVFSLFLPVE